MAYPLQGIVGVQSLKFVVNKDLIRRVYIQRMVLVGIIGLCLSGGLFQAAEVLGVLGVLAAVGLIVLLVRQMNNKLNQPPVYALTVQNAAGSQNLVYSEDGQQIDRIVSGIIDAIDDSNTKFGPITINQSQSITTGRDYISAGPGSSVATGRSA